MKYDQSGNTLGFSSEKEVEQFHLQLSELVRGAMVGATRGIEDAQCAKNLSREVLRELNVVIRVLNALRSGLPRKTF